jgi:TM2 domain-containing membrane protein YozV
MTNAQYNPNTQYQYAPRRKSKIIAGLLAIFLGAFGVHNFYLGFIGKGVAQLLITLLSLGILSWVSAIWGIIEGIFIIASHEGDTWHRDARNIELED